MRMPEIAWLLDAKEGENIEFKKAEKGQPGPGNGSPLTGLPIASELTKRRNHEGV